MRRTSARPVAAALLAASAALISCSSGPDDHSAAGSATTQPAAEAPTKACSACHADVVDAFPSTTHALAARPAAGATLQAEIPATITADATELRVSRPTPEAPPTMTVPDTGGSLVDVETDLVLGGRRQESFVGIHAGERVVLPLAWSQTLGQWTDAVDGDPSSLPEAGSAYGWQGRRRRFDDRCASCHPASHASDPTPSSDSSPVSSPDSSDDACTHCHANAEAHAKAQSRPSATPVAASIDSDWSGCADCHATGTRTPEQADARHAHDFVSRILPATLVSRRGRNAAFYVDGRPASAHGYEVQALVQSACFREGGATCVTCHDLHAAAGAHGSLRAADPDASCRGCHAEIADAGSAHSHHPVPEAPVPPASDEPTGPDPKRAPGCVDCHLPTVVSLGPNDLARDHAIGNPEPLNTWDLGVPNACSTCHAQTDPSALALVLDEWFPERDDRRRRWALALASGLGHRPATIDERVTGLVGMLEDSLADDWTRATTARLLGATDVVAESEAARSALLGLLVPGSDPVLLRAAARAVVGLGEAAAEPLAALIAGDDDWRVRVVAAATLDAVGDRRGLLELERLQARTDLPSVAEVEVAFELGQAMLRRQSHRRAEALFSAVTRRSPDDPAAWLNLGVARASLDDHEGARLAWHAVLEIDPNHVPARTNLEALAVKDADRPTGEP